MVVSRCYINLQFPDDDDEGLFICLYAICVSSSVMFLFMYFAHLKFLFYILLLKFKIFFVYLNASNFLDICFSNIFSLPMAYFFILLKIYFTEQGFFILIKSTLSIFSFLDHAFCVISKNSLSNLMSPQFSSISFIVLHLTFTSKIYFELVFVVSV